MKPFNVVALGRFLEENSVEVALKSFAEYYFSVSLKYQKKSKLILIDKSFNQNLNRQLAVDYKLGDSITCLALNEQDEVEKSYQEGSLLLLPRIINSSSIIKEAFRYGLPVLCYKHASYIHLLDTSCGCLLYTSPSPRDRG